MSKRIRRPRVLLAEDDTGVGTAISRLLAPSCEVIGCVRDSATLFDTVVRLQPDVVLIDFSLPGGRDGLEVCRHVKTIAPEVSIIVFTGNDDVELRRLTHEAGAAGFVWKLDAASVLLPTIRAVIDRKVDWT